MAAWGDHERREQERRADDDRRREARRQADRDAADEAAMREWDCECGAGPFDSPEAVERHAAQWHPLIARLHLGAEIVARFSVAGFNARQIDALVGELCAQAESSDDHPSAEVLEMSAPFLPREGRTILVHVNLTLPPDAPATADDVAREIEAALEIAAEDPSGNAPALQACDLVEIALAEEI